MRTKLKLNLEQLSVDSFDTTRPAAKAGTVFGEQCTCYTNCTCPGCPTCDASCNGTCDALCDVTWDASCDTSCMDTCRGSCGGSCNTCYHQHTCDRECEYSVQWTNCDCY
jgi:hypothetical protein